MDPDDTPPPVTGTGGLTLPSIGGNTPGDDSGE